MLKLSICVITMNRAEQLVQALESCMDCNLPNGTEFVVLDNASTDDTEKRVKDFSAKYPNITVNYKFSPNNLGVGGGRAAAFELAKGDITYFLDDDAVIADESKEQFFTKSLSVFENNPEVASLTTKIYDELLNINRENEIGEVVCGEVNLPLIFHYLGGSHYLRKEYFDSPLYLNIKYGSEEFYPSIVVQDKGYFNVIDKDLCIIHKPKVNKWVDGSENMKNVLINGTANVYATKRILYPLVVRPLLWAGYMARCLKYLRPYNGAIAAANKAVKKLVKENKGSKKIKFKTVIRFLKQYGLSAF